MIYLKSTIVLLQYFPYMDPKSAKILVIVKKIQNILENLLAETHIELSDELHINVRKGV